jgi:hypothetical protein
MATVLPDIAFNEYVLPPLEAGNYRATASQQVAGTQPGTSGFAETFAAELCFAVQGLRFRLPPDYLQTQYPAPAGQGDYAAVLPHVVLTATTLPWQRDPAVPNAGATRYPWLAVLVFDETETADSAQWQLTSGGTLADLMTPPAGVCSYPNLALEYGESLTDNVNYLDVARDLFAAVAPQAAELPWLSHVRSLSVATTEARATTAGGLAPEREFAVVVSNRLPRPDALTTCCLVSLEGMGSYLPGQAGPPAGASQVRLAVLASWSFASVSQPESFRDYFMALDTDPATLQVPYPNATGTANTAVSEALQMGYVPLGHTTRQGARIVSWYRGPLLPFAVAAAVSVPVPSADALTNYNPDNAMPDVALGAAWQVGRLLALQDEAFATTLYNWRRGQEQSAVTAFEQDFLLSALHPLPADLARHAAAPGEAFHQRLLRETVLPALAPLRRRAASSSPNPTV